MKIAVTGCAGFIGFTTTKLLLAEGHSVIGIDNFRTGDRNKAKQLTAHPEFDLREIDLSEVNEYIKEKDIDAVLHLAALVSVTEGESLPSLNFDLNIANTQTILEFARTNRIRRFVFASSAAVYGNSEDGPIKESTSTLPINLYGSAKLISELLLRQYTTSFGLETISLRYFNVYGAGQPATSPYSGVITKFNQCLSCGQTPTIFGDGSQTRDFIHVSDIARANILALTRRGIANGSYNVCSGQAHKVKDVFEALKTIHGLDSMDPILEPERQGDIKHSLGCGAKLRKELGFFPLTDINQGLISIDSKQ